MPNLIGTLILILVTALSAAGPRQPKAPPPAPSATPAATATAVPLPAESASCTVDWSRPHVIPDNLRPILSELRAGCTPLCPPAGSPWEATFNTGYCWQANHGPATPTPQPYP